MSMDQVVFPPVVEDRTLEPLEGDTGFLCEAHCVAMPAIDRYVEDSFGGAVDHEEGVAGINEGVVYCAVDLVCEGVYCRVSASVIHSIRDTHLRRDCELSATYCGNAENDLRTPSPRPQAVLCKVPAIPLVLPTTTLRLPLVLCRLENSRIMLRITLWRHASSWRIPREASKDSAVLQNVSEGSADERDDSRCT